MFVSCKSNVVDPVSIFIILGLDDPLAPITNLLPLSLRSNVEPNCVLDAVLGASILCCNEYVFVDPSAFHL